MTLLPLKSPWKCRCTSCQRQWNASCALNCPQICILHKTASGVWQWYGGNGWTCTTISFKNIRFRLLFQLPVPGDPQHYCIIGDAKWGFQQSWSEGSWMPKQHFNPLNFTDETISSKNNHQFFPPEKKKSGQFLPCQVYRQAWFLRLSLLSSEEKQVNNGNNQQSRVKGEEKPPYTTGLPATAGKCIPPC